MNEPACEPACENVARAGRRLLGAQLGLVPVVALPMATDAAGSSSLAVVTPSGLGGSLAVPTVWLSTVVCPAVRPLSSSAGLGRRTRTMMRRFTQRTMP